MMDAASSILRIEPVIESGRPRARRNFASHDGAWLFYRCWPALRAPARGAVVLLHDAHEHSARIQHVAEELGLHDLAFFAWDARGHGCSPGRRGDSPGAGSLVKDLDCFVRHVADGHGIRMEDIAVVAQGSGAVLAAAWARDYAPAIRCLVLAAPAFKAKLYLPFARAALRGLYRWRGNFFMSTRLREAFLTHSPQRKASYRSDPLIARAGSVRMLLELEETADRLIEDAYTIELPVQLLISGSDRLVQRRPQVEFFERLGSENKELHVFDGFYHDALGETYRELAFTRMRAFIDQAFARTRPGPGPNTTRHAAGREGCSAGEKLRIAALRLLLRALGRLSHGMRIGVATGFDSAATREYVHANRARGATRLGLAVDRLYLDATSCKGIRMRKHHLQRAICCAAQRLRSDGMPVKIVDVAAGHDYSVLDAVELLPRLPDSVLLQDLDFNVVDQGAALIRERKLGHIARFVQGDAFDAESLAALAPYTTVAVVAGLYERFRENTLLDRSLRGLAAAVPAGGCLIYTGQMRGSRLEDAAPARDAHSAFPQRRSQAELDRMVADAGFRKLEQWIDDWGMYTVSLAVRV